MQPAADPKAAAERAAGEIAARTGRDEHDVALVLGSGWRDAADVLGPALAEFSTTAIHGFAPPAAQGHAGLIRSIDCNGRRCLVFLGRTHLYEGHGVHAVVHGVRTAAATGCRTVILTNSAGSLQQRWPPGTAVLIADHINLTGATPLHGADFVDLTEVYSTRLRRRCGELDPSLAEGVYVQFAGPQYETPAEIRMVRAVGGDLVGMSTALEAIAARAAGMDVLGISLVSNLAAGMAPAPLDHADVLAEGRAAAGRIGGLLADVVGSL
jgi:purine-nucleoside phosphorylase